MPRTALILGATGRFGRHMADALVRHGWSVRRFDRNTDSLRDAAHGADLIVNAWNPPYSRWKVEVPKLTQLVIEAAQASGAAVMIPGNIYVYGEDLPPVLSPLTPHQATHGLGKIRRSMEAAYRDAGVKTIILRAGDFLDTEASGTWFDRVIAAKISKGRFSYPGPLDKAHTWAYLPDLAEVAAQLADQLETLPQYLDLLFEGYTLTGSEMAAILERALGRAVCAKPMAWLPIQLARPFWREARYLLEMRYLWQRPHSIDGSALAERLPGFTATPVEEALYRATKPLCQNSTSTQISRWSEASSTTSANGPSDGQRTPAP